MVECFFQIGVGDIQWSLSIFMMVKGLVSSLK